MIFSSSRSMDKIKTMQEGALSFLYDEHDSSNGDLH